MMRRGLLIVLALWTIAANGLAEEPSACKPPMISCSGQYFVSFSLGGDALKGDFDGRLILGNSEKAFYIPDLKPALGFSLGFGEKLRSGLWMVSYSMTPHRASFAGRTGHSASHLLEVCGKACLFPRAVVHPYIRMGFDLAWLHVAGGAVKGNSICNANYSGLGVNGGAGFFMPLRSRLFIDIGASFRYLAYIYAYGPGRPRDVTNLNINRSGPRRETFLKVPGWRWEITFGYLL